jgi:hypothetical protein
MAMRKPRTWIVGDKGKDHPSSRGQKRSVSSGRIGQVQHRRAFVICACTRAQHKKVVSVKMDRMRERNWRLNNEIDPLADSVERNQETATVGRSCSAFGNLKESGIVVLRQESCSIQRPLKKRGVVGSNNNSQGTFCEVCSARRERNNGNNVTVCLVNAFVSVRWPNRIWCS